MTTTNSPSKVLHLHRFPRFRGAPIEPTYAQRQYNQQPWESTVESSWHCVTNNSTPQKGYGFWDLRYAGEVEFSFCNTKECEVEGWPPKKTTMQKGEHVKKKYDWKNTVGFCDFPMFSSLINVIPRKCSVQEKQWKKQCVSLLWLKSLDKKSTYPYWKYCWWWGVQKSCTTWDVSNLVNNMG